MNKPCFKLLIWIAMLLSVSSKLVAQEITYKHFSFNNGLPSATIYHIIQDKKGFIWLGTDAGVSRFDGNKFVNYTLSDGLSENEILTIGEDSMGRIWFLGFNGTVSYYYEGKIYNRSNNNLIKRLPKTGTLHYFYEDKAHRIWLSSADGYTIIDGNEISFRKADKYTSESGGLVYSTKNNKLKFIQNFNKGYAYLPDNVLLYTRSDSILTLKESNTELLLRMNNELSKSVITGLSMSADKKLWISTGGSGVHKYDCNDLQKPPERYLEDKVLGSITTDREGNIWVGSINDGVYMLQPRHGIARTYNSTNSMLSNNIYSVIRTNNGNIYAGMDSGKVCVINSKGIKIIPLINPGYAHNRVTALESVQHDLLAGSDKGLIHYNPEIGANHFLLFGNKGNKDIEKRAIKDICITNNGIGICEGYSVSTCQLNSKVGHEAEIVKKIDTNIARKYCIFSDVENTLWYSAAGGLYSFDGKTLKYHPVINNYSTEKITAIDQTNDSTLILATYGNGILMYKNGRITNVLNKESGLSNDICKRISIHKNNVHVATANGLTVFAYNNGTINNIHYYTTAYGLESNNINDVFATDSVICVATSGGLTLLNAFANIEKAQPPVLYINSAKCLNETIKTDSSYTFNYKQNSLHFNYIAISFRAPESIKYRYRIDKNDEWLYTRNTSVDLLYLPTGNYEFELSARVLDSEWSEPVKFTFTIAPPFWRTYIFYLSVVIFLGIGLFIALRFRSRKAETKRNEELKIKNQIVLLEQQALQAMMNPHFIFNVMNTIQQAINNSDTYKANVYLSDFAKLIRLNMDISVRSAIPLEEEIAYLELYLSLEKIRFGDRLSYNISVDKDIDEYETMIPVMILQPFIENAIWHGILPKSTNGHVQISIKKAAKESLMITIRDNGKGLQHTLPKPTLQVKSHISRGMSLTRQRLELIGKITKKEVSLEITDAYPDEINKGTMVRLILPATLTS